MSEELSVDLAGLRGTAAGQRGIAERAMLVAAELKSAIAGAGVAWGTDKPGKTFEEFYLPSSEQAVEALDSVVVALEELGSGLARAADEFEFQDFASGSDIVRQDPYAREREPIPSETGPGAGAQRAVSPGSGSAQNSADYSAPTIADQHGGERLSPPTSTLSGDDRQNPARHDNPSDLPRPRTPEVAEPEVPGVATGGRGPVPGSGPAGQAAVVGKPGESQIGNRPGSATPVSSASTSTGRAAPTPWSGGFPKDIGGAPGKGVSAPAAPSRADGPPPPRPMTPQTAPPRKSAQPAPPRSGRRPAPEPVVGRAVNAHPATHTDPMTLRATDPEVLRIAAEMAARHGLTLLGFETAGIGEPAVRELADALDQVLTTHHVLDLRVVEIAECPDGVTAGTRWDLVGGGNGPATKAARLILDRTKIAEPNLPTSEDPATGRATGSIYKEVVRELARVLDTMGGHAAHRKVQRALIRHYLEEVDPQRSRRSLSRVVAGYQRWRITVPGAGTAGFDPEAILVEAFAEVTAGSIQAGAAGSLYRLLVEAAVGSR